jgi:hypothetical protein
MSTVTQTCGGHAVTLFLLVPLVNSDPAASTHCSFWRTKSKYEEIASKEGKAAMTSAGKPLKGIMHRQEKGFST